jgi:hypothetical protein
VLSRIGIELVLVVAIFFIGGTFWQLQKGRTFLRRAIRDPKLLASLISLDTLSCPPPRVAFFAQKNEIGYFLNIGIVINSDEKSQRLPKAISCVLLGCLFVGSYFLGWPFLAANLVLFPLLSFAGLSESGRLNALEQVLTLAVILHRWHGENPGECDQWVRQGQGSLRTLYEAVKAVRA